MSTSYELHRILAENSMLRKQITDASMQLSEAWSSYAKIHQENDNLRELCETFGMIANDAICDYFERDELLAQANMTARELGVKL